MADQNTHIGNSMGDLFTKNEMKRFFIRYLAMLGFIELFIFFVSFLATFKPYSSSFPWREYFYAAFTIPIGITILLGIIVIAFNTYYFQDAGHLESLKKSFNNDAFKTMSKTKLFLNLSWQFQFLLFLLGLGLSALLMFHSDDVFALFSRTGEKAFNWLMVSLGILVAGIVLFGVLYLWLHYKLIKRRMEYVNQYKWEMMSHMGMLLLDDNTVIDREGKVIYKPLETYEAENMDDKALSDDISLLPHIMKIRNKSE